MAPSPNQPPDDDLSQPVARAIEGALAVGHLDYPGLLAKCQGADPRSVRCAIDAMVEAGTVVRDDGTYRLADGPPLPDWPSARARSIDFRRELPPADPVACQWWFDVDTCVRLCERVWELAAGGPVAFLGTPILAHFYSCAGGPAASAFDMDADVISRLTAEACLEAAILYDVYDELPDAHERCYSAVVADPPWYPSVTLAFIARARQMAADGGAVLCTLPGLLTRPSALRERHELLAQLAARAFQVVAIAAGPVEYVVPEFEARAYGDVDGFDGRSWRRGDLLTLRVDSDTGVPDFSTQDRPPPRITFGRQGRRVFLTEEAAASGPPVELTEDPDFARTVSARQVPFASIGMWTSDRRGYSVSGGRAVAVVLRSWAAGAGPAAAEQKLAAELDRCGAKHAVRVTNDALGLWPTAPSPPPLRRAERLREIRAQSISRWCAHPSDREHAASSQHFRLEFQRDRDRIVWSGSLKRLAAKTQMLPLEHHAPVRTRLTHSLEVAQLAVTIARAFGLDPDLTEAIGLGHDIGHPPFGHAGEDALNRWLDDIHGELGGFNHCEHSVDVLRWLEDAYLSPGGGGHVGLGLTPEVYEGIFKHMFHYDGPDDSQQALHGKSKHSDLFPDGFCHLEGQAVRLADKISFLIEDLEDALAAGAVSLERLRTCRLFSRPGVDLAPAPGESDHERFVSQRGALLTVLMSDALEETERRLSGLADLEAVRNAKDYVASHSLEIAADVGEVWSSILVSTVHKDYRVVRGNLRAARTLRALLELFTFCPSLVDPRFRRLFDAPAIQENYVRLYEAGVEGGSVTIRREKVQPFYLSLASDAGITETGAERDLLVPVSNVVMAKCYVAQLTDEEALEAHRTFVAGEPRTP